MARPKEVTIRDDEGQEHQYVIGIIPGDDGLVLLGELGAICGDSVGEILGAVASWAGSGEDGGDMDGDLDGALLGQAVGGLLRRVHEKGVLKLARRLLEHVTRDGKSFYSGAAGDGVTLSFAATFKANYGELREVLTEVLKLNYRSFFTGLLTAPAQLKATMRHHVSGAR